MIKEIRNVLREARLERLRTRLKWKAKEAEAKAEMYNKSHSLLWIWEFSKKAVLICFSFYAIVQIYSMVVMIVYKDFVYLSDLINQAGEIVRDCVFGYLVKAGVENIGKILVSRSDEDEADG